MRVFPLLIGSARAYRRISAAGGTGAAGSTRGIELTRNTVQRPTYRAHQRLLEEIWRARYVMAVDLAVVEDRVLSLVHRIRAERADRSGLTAIPRLPTQRQG